MRKTSTRTKILGFAIAILVGFMITSFSVHTAQAQCAPVVDKMTVSPTTISKTKPIINIKVNLSGLGCTEAQLSSWELKVRDKSYAWDIIVPAKLSDYFSGVYQGKLTIEQTVNLDKQTTDWLLLKSIRPTPQLNSTFYDDHCKTITNTSGTQGPAASSCVGTRPSASGGAGIQNTDTFVGGLDESVGLFANPIESGNLPELIVRAVQVMLALVGGAATVVIVISGFQLVVSGSVPAKRATAIKAITWAVVGLVLALMSFSIVAILQNIISR